MLKMGRAISLKKREIVFTKQNGKCAICGRTFNLIKKTHDCYYDGDVMNIDHIYPKSLGGGNNIENLRGLCYRCNTSRCNKVGQVAADVILNSINRIPIESFIKRMADDLQTGISTKKQVEMMKQEIICNLIQVIDKVNTI